MEEKPETDSPKNPGAVAGSDLALPFSGWWPLLAGALAGVALRLIFSGRPGGQYAAMMGAFIYLSPVIVGAVTVYVAETRKRRSWGYYIGAPFLANVLYVLGTLLVMIEGLVCALVIVPLFAVLGALGGLIMGIVCRATNWPRRALLGVGALPLLLGSIETGLPMSDRIGAVERSITVAATPDRVWAQILNARDIEPTEVGGAWLFRIGVPMPLAGITRDTPDGPVRTVTMGKDVHFDEVITDWQENRHLQWRYRFAEDSFPPKSLDEHVAIGGLYFDLQDASYTLTPKGDKTELHVRMRYRVTTRFNWYADPIAKLLLGNVEEVNLEYYRRRSERTRPEGEARR